MGVQKGCRKGVLAQKGGCTKGAQRAHKGCGKGAERVLELPFQQEGCVWKIWENGPFRTKVKISHQKGRKHVAIGPKPLFNRTRW